MEWDRRQDEPMMWFSRFEIFREIGPLRTIETAWREDRAKQRNPKSAKRPHCRWYEVAKEWDWKNRAEAWDEWCIRQQRAAEVEAIQEIRRRDAAARVEAREKRRKLLDDFVNKITEVLPEYPESESLNELTKAIQVAAQELRAEYNDLPVQKLGFAKEEDLDDAIEQEFRRLLGKPGQELEDLASGSEAPAIGEAAQDTDTQS